MAPHKTPSRWLVVALVLASASLMTLDATTDDGSAVDPARQAVGEVFGPIEAGTTAVVRPISGIPEWFRGRDSMREEIDDLEAENAELRAQVRTSGFNRNRLAEYDGLTAAAEDLGYALVPARVIGLGPSQSFSATVTTGTPVSVAHAPAWSQLPMCMSAATSPRPPSPVLARRWSSPSTRTVDTTRAAGQSGSRNASHQ